MLRLLGQLIALSIVPIILIAGMALTVALHGIMVSLAGTTALASIITTFLSLGLFIATVWFCVYWVRTSGLTLFQLA